MMHYPTKQQLDAMGATLEKDVALCPPALHRWFHGAQTQAVRTQAAPTPLPERPRKPYQSSYIGVSLRYTGYCGHWSAAPGKYVRGPVRPTEREAAQDRAAALGLDYLEVRG
jgi:hypothetical protein